MMLPMVSSISAGILTLMEIFLFIANDIMNNTYITL